MSIVLERIFSQILEMSIIAGYCVLAVLLLRWLFRKAPKRYTYLLWLVVAFRLVCPLTVDSAFSIFNLNLMPESMKAESEIGEQIEELELPGLAPEVGGSTSELPNSTLGVGGSASAAPEIGGTMTGGSESDSSANNRPGSSMSPLPQLPDQTIETKPQTNLWQEIDWQTVGAWVWVLGMIILSVFMIVSWIRLKLRVRTAVKVRTRVYETDMIDSAFVMGIRKPTIYLPVGLNRQEQAWVLLHETSHIRRKDYLVKMLATVLTIVYWFHPLVWVAWFGMCRDMEMSCDEMALEGASGELRKAYSRTLLTVATNKRLNWNVITAFGEVSVKSRIKHVLSFKKPAVWMGAMFAVVLVAALVVFGTNGQAKDGADVNAGVEESTGAEVNGEENTEEIGTEAEETEGTTEEMPQQPTEDYSDRTWDYNGAGEAWIDLAKDAFDKQWVYDSAQDIGEEKRKELFGIPKRLVEFPIGYTGFMDIYPDEKECIPVQDYDGDGLMDRVFQRYIAETEDQEVYLFLGSGQVIMLDDSAWTGYWLESVDLTHDGKAEVTYWENIYYMGDGGEETYCTIYENTETGMQKMDGSGLFGIELIFERINENTLRVTTPEGTFSYTLDISEYLDVLWWYYYVPKMDEKSKTETRWASYYYIYYDETSGKYKFRCWGGEILGFSMDWDVVYENGEWTAENVALRGVEMPFGSRELNRELTEKSLSKGISLQSLLGHRAENSETIYLDVDQSGGVYIYGDYFALGSRFCGFCDGVYAKDWEEMTITLDREILPTVEENLPETLTIKRQTIDGEEYYVVDYLGENLYFYVHNK